VRVVVSREITLSLARVDELFGPVSFPELGGSADLHSGIERLVTQLKSGARGPVRAVLTLPEHELGPESEERIRAAIDHYCELREAESQSERAALRRVGLAALGVGLPILFVGLALYTVLHRAHATDILRIYVGNGILLVTAWVGLWYPLDTLLHYDRPYRQELQALRRLHDAELVIQPAPADA
jgi:hypothetical protein